MPSQERAGMVGVFVLAIGGAISFEGLYTLLEAYSGRYGTPSFGSVSFGADFIGFFGFLFIGFGLYLIVHSGKIETKQNPS